MKKKLSFSNTTTICLALISSSYILPSESPRSSQKLPEEQGANAPALVAQTATQAGWLAYFFGSGNTEPRKLTVEEQVQEITVALAREGQLFVGDKIVPKIAKTYDPAKLAGVLGSAIESIYEEEKALIEKTLRAKHDVDEELKKQRAEIRKPLSQLLAAYVATKHVSPATAKKAQQTRKEGRDLFNTYLQELMSATSIESNESKDDRNGLHDALVQGSGASVAFRQATSPACSPTEFRNQFFPGGEFKPTTGKTSKRLVVKDKQ